MAHGGPVPAERAERPDWGRGVGSPGSHDVWLICACSASTAPEAVALDRSLLDVSSFEAFPYRRAGEGRLVTLERSGGLGLWQGLKHVERTCGRHRLGGCACPVARTRVHRMCLRRTSLGNWKVLRGRDESRCFAARLPIEQVWMSAVADCGLGRAVLGLPIGSPIRWDTETPISAVTRSGTETALADCVPRSQARSPERQRAPLSSHRPPRASSFALPTLSPAPSARLDGVTCAVTAFSDLGLNPRCHSGVGTNVATGRPSCETVHVA